MRRFFGVGLVWIIALLAHGSSASSSGNHLVADESVSSESAVDDESDQPCWYFDRQPRRCQYNGCEYNYSNDRCVQRWQPNRVWTCSAVDFGWEEHWRGHYGRGWTRYQAARQAIANCQSYHGQCQVGRCWQD